MSNSDVWTVDDDFIAQQQAIKRDKLQVMAEDCAAIAAAPTAKPSKQHMASSRKTAANAAAAAAKHAAIANLQSLINREPAEYYRFIEYCADRMRTEPPIDDAATAADAAAISEEGDNDKRDECKAASTKP